MAGFSCGVLNLVGGVVLVGFDSLGVWWGLLWWDYGC